VCTRVCACVCLSCVCVFMRACGCVYVRVCARAPTLTYFRLDRDSYEAMVGLMQLFRAVVAGDALPIRTTSVMLPCPTIARKTTVFDASCLTNSGRDRVVDSTSAH
jgi:hypothetical protein